MSENQDRVFDRFVHYDERSKAFGLSATIPTPVDRSRKRVWTPGPLLDQGREGACVGFGTSGELGATPTKVPVDNSFALNLYAEAQKVDRAEGRNYSSGATVLAGMKAAKNLGLIREYRWAGVEDRSVTDDVIDALLRHGPVVIGIVWKDGMYDTSPDGLVDITGSVVGGHCIYVHGWWPNHPKFGDVFVWQNSWGPYYGMTDPAGVPTGRGFVKAADLEALLKDDGEAVVPTDTRKKAAA